MAAASNAQDAPADDRPTQARRWPSSGNEGLALLQERGEVIGDDRERPNGSQEFDDQRLERFRIGRPLVGRKDDLSGLDAYSIAPSGGVKGYAIHRILDIHGLQVAGGGSHGPEEEGRLITRDDQPDPGHAAGNPELFLAPQSSAKWLVRTSRPARRAGGPCLPDRARRTTPNAVAWKSAGRATFQTWRIIRPSVAGTGFLPRFNGPRGTRSSPSR